MDDKKNDSMVKRVGGYLHRIVPVMDSAGKVLSYALSPVMIEFRLRDLMQVIVGASILAVPVAMTEETWTLGEKLPMANVLALSGLSLLFISLFVYFNFYRYNFKGNVLKYIQRVLSIYVFSLLVVGTLLTIIMKCPWQTDFTLALKRILIVTFPACMSAAISDTMK